MEFAKKKFGQNFITDLNLINKIINLLGPDKDQIIIEIGPGRGALTKELVKKYNKVIAFEIDKDMESVLLSQIKQENFELYIQDILETDLKEFLKKINSNKISIISNIPYYITSEIIFRTFDASEFLNKAIFMVQKEVAKRICAKENENNYNNLSVATSFYSDVKYEFTVKKQMFNPIPKVDSAIISMSFKDEYKSLVKDDKKFVNFVRKLFNNKRKTILNNLTNVISDKQQAIIYLDKLSISSNLRPENIDLITFIKLYKEVYND